MLILAGYDKHKRYIKQFSCSFAHYATLSTNYFANYHFAKPIKFPSVYFYRPKMPIEYEACILANTRDSCLR